MAGPLRPPLAPKARVHRRKRQRETIPDLIRRAVIEFAQALQGNHAAVFAGNPRLKHRVARLLAAELPPSRRPGRPGLPEVTDAQRMFDEFRRMYPDEPSRRLWRRIYPAIIAGYDLLNKIERQAAEQVLSNRARWRRRARRRALTRRIDAQFSGFSDHAFDDKLDPA